MRVKFNRKCEYPQNEESQSRVYEEGKVYDLEPNHARRWIRRGVADEVGEEPEPAKEPIPPETLKKPIKPETKGK